VLVLQERTDVGGVATERLEAEICELAGQIAAASARLVVMIAEYDDRRGWAEWGCQSAAHWLSWRCGIGMHAAREKLRVGHALSGLPLITAAFARGELSYSQVRAVTRIAGDHNDAALVEIARSSTAHQLERLVAATARAERVWDEGFAGAQLAGRFLRTGFDYDLAMFTAKVRLSADDGRIVTKALQLAATQLQAERGELGPDSTPEQLLADALVALASSFWRPASRSGPPATNTAPSASPTTPSSNPNPRPAIRTTTTAAAPGSRPTRRMVMRRGRTSTAARS